LAVAVVVSAQSGSTSANANDSLFAALEGKNEAPAKGDNDGRGSFAATFEGNTLCFGMTVKNIQKPAAAHIHKGAAGTAGGVVVELGTPKAGDPGSVSGCVNVPAGMRKDILKKPGGFYVNVHTASFGGGAIRGQLFAKTP
jgi:hypothetical protein